MIKITAHIPARTLKGTTGKIFSYQAQDRVFEQDEDGVWYTECFGKKEAISEADVIDVCKKATNWEEIKSIYFRMVGFHN